MSRFCCPGFAGQKLADVWVWVSTIFTIHYLHYLRAIFAAIFALESAQDLRDTTAL